LVRVEIHKDVAMTRTRIRPTIRLALWISVLALLVSLAPAPTLVGGPGASPAIRVERVATRPVAGLTGGSSIRIDLATNRPFRVYFSADYTRGLLTSLGWSEGYVTRWKAAPLYLQLSACERLLDGLASDDASPVWHDYQWQPGTHDMRRKAGRAARAFEECLGVQLPAVGPDTSPADVAAIHRTAAAAVRKFHAETLAAETAKRPEHSVESLRLKYQGRIRPRAHAGIGAEEARESIDALDDLLREWCPIGQSVETLERIVGVPLDTLRQGSLRYFFTYEWADLLINNGNNVRRVRMKRPGGAEFTFVTEKGIIRCVNWLDAGE
jgi:hypothetical protein